MAWSGEPPITFGRLYCHTCHAMQWFVSWDESQVSPEHAECRECGFRYPVTTVKVVDPKTFEVRIERVSALDPEVFQAAVAEARREFARDMMSLARTRGQPFDPSVIAAYVGPQPPHR